MSDEALEFILRELIDRLQADPAVCVDLSDLQNRFVDVVDVQHGGDYFVDKEGRTR